MSEAPILLWFRRDLRLSDHPMLAEALATGRPLIPVFVLDPGTEAIGAAARWRLGLGVAAFAARLDGLGSRLILRRGPAAEVLDGLIAETGAAGVLWSRSYDPAIRARDASLKAGLLARGLVGHSIPGFLLHEPWAVKTGQDGFYRVYTPFWKAVRDRDVPQTIPAPNHLPKPPVWPASDRLEDWQMGAGMLRGAAVLRPYARVGEAEALARLHDFIVTKVDLYKARRDLMAEDTCSGLSENLTYGEISPRQIWHEGMRAMQAGAGGAEHFLKELVWREFAWHLLHHTPHIAHSGWRPEWDAFPWRGDTADAEAWRRGMTGEPIVDAAMRQMYVTGTMHNRARMITASYLIKHLLTHWKVGMDWFAECLTDWDPASNAMGWQWVAGSGPDASPYFRIFNPTTQAKTFDPDSIYQRRHIAELSQKPGKLALDYFEAVPRSWGLDAGQRYPLPLIALQDGRARALTAFSQRNA